MSAIILENDLLHYEVLGRGKPVFFLHSWFGSWRYWISAMQQTSLNYRAYALDMWGYGDSAKNQKYLYAQQVQMVLDFMDKLGIFRIALVGHGLGAFIAMEIARLHPDLIDRVLLIAYPFQKISINDPNREELLSELNAFFPDGIQQNENFQYEINKTDWNAVQFGFPNKEEIEVVASLQTIEPSCLFVHGRHDPIVTVPSSDTIERIPDKHHVIIFEQSAHYPMLDESSKFNRLLGDFLALENGESLKYLQLKEEWKRRVR